MRSRIIPDQTIARFRLELSTKKNAVMQKHYLVNLNLLHCEQLPKWILTSQMPKKPI